MRYPIFGIGQKGKSVNVTAQSRLNCYLDIQPQEDKSQITLHRRPGYDLFASFGDTAIRGMIAFEGMLYLVHRNVLWEVSTAGVKTNRGTIGTSTGRVGMAANRGDQIMITDGAAGYTYTITGSTLAAITDVDYPDAATTVAFHDGYFIVEEPGTSIFHISAIDNGISWPADTASAEKSPDELVRVVDNTTEIILMGTASMEFWNNTGAIDFPYERVTGGALEIGLNAKWSVANYGESSIICLTQSRHNGDVRVTRIDGFSHIAISTPELDSLINDYTTSNATAFTYSHQGHLFYQLNFPTDGKTWLYDGTSNLWSETSYGANEARDRGEISIAFNGKTYVSDYENGNLYQLNSNSYSDNGEPVVVEFVGRHIFDEKYVRISRLWLDIESGVGTVTGAGSDPTVLLSISRDGGHSYGNEKETSIGQIGEYQKRAIFRRLGRSYDWVFKIRITDPVKTTIIGAWVDIAA